MTLKEYVENSVSESRSQQAVIKWWSLKCREFGLAENLLMAFPLQGARSVQNGARMKAEGMRRGTPDMFLAVKEGCLSEMWYPKARPGLWIELKTPKGTISPQQKNMLTLLSAQGFAVAVCRSFDETEKTIGRYLGAP